jgi:LacI family transcriptional regulator
MKAAIQGMRGRVDGLIAMSAHLDAASIVATVPDTMPIVLLNGAASPSRYDAISIDNRRGAFRVVRHLLALGHQRIAFISGATGNTDAAERARGYRRAMRDAGAAPPNEVEISSDSTESSGYHAAQRLLESTPRPTAIFAATDAMAIGAISALRDAGLRVPEDIAVAGFDDIPLARYMSPRLTSVHVGMAELGSRAVETLLHAVAHKDAHIRCHQRLQTRLVVRESCGAHLNEGRSG